jgi:hypothetical protein
VAILSWGKKKFSRAKVAFYSVNMVIFAYAEFPPVPFPFMFGVLLGKGSFHPTFFLCGLNHTFST